MYTSEELEQAIKVGTIIADGGHATIYRTQLRGTSVVIKTILKMRTEAEAKQRWPDEVYNQYWGPLPMRQHDKCNAQELLALMRLGPHDNLIKLHGFGMYTGVLSSIPYTNAHHIQCHV